MEQPKSEGADGNPGGEITENRAESDALEKRSRDDGRSKQGDNRQQVYAVGLSSHVSLRISR